VESGEVLKKNFMNKCAFSLIQVIVPTGIRVVLERNNWGIDVTIYTPRATNRKHEEGLCTYEKNQHGDITKFGENLRWVFVIFDFLKWNKHCLILASFIVISII